MYLRFNNTFHLIFIKKPIKCWQHLTFLSSSFWESFFFVFHSSIFFRKQKIIKSIKRVATLKRIRNKKPKNSREYARIRPNSGWCSISVKKKLLRWAGGTLCFAQSCHVVATPLSASTVF